MTTWSTTAKNANVALSNGNLTATASGFFCGRTDLLVTSGQKRTIEVTCGAVGDPTGPGVCNTTASMAGGRFVGDDANGTGHYEDGHCWKGFVVVEELSTFGAGDVIGVHVWSGNKVWWSKNGLFDNGDNPATNTGGVDISGMGDVAFAYVVNGPLTANFGATVLAHAPPAGFTTPDSLPAVIGTLNITEAGDTISAAGFKDWTPVVPGSGVWTPQSAPSQIWTGIPPAAPW